MKNTTLLIIAFIIIVPVLKAQTTEQFTVKAEDPVNLPLKLGEEELFLLDTWEDLGYYMHEAARSGKVAVYKAYQGLSFDYDFTDQIQKHQLPYLGSGGPDTIGYEDPKTGEWVEQIVFSEFEPAAIEGFALSGYWVSGPEGVQSFVVSGIAPVMELFDDKGKIIGMIHAYRVKFDELMAVLEKDLKVQAGQGEVQVFPSSFQNTAHLNFKDEKGPFEITFTNSETGEEKKLENVPGAPVRLTKYLLKPGNYEVKIKGDGYKESGSFEVLKFLSE